MPNNVVQVAYDTTAKAIYNLIRNTNADVWNGTTFVPYVSGSLTLYANNMTEQGVASRYYVGPFPAGATSAGSYPVTVFVRAGASPAETDVTIAGGALDWNGSALVSFTQGVGNATAGTLTVVGTVQSFSGTLNANVVSVNGTSAAAAALSFATNDSNGKLIVNTKYFTQSNSNVYFPNNATLANVTLVNTVNNVGTVTGSVLGGVNGFNGSMNVSSGTLQLTSLSTTGNLAIGGSLTIAGDISLAGFVDIMGSFVVRENFSINGDFVGDTFSFNLIQAVDHADFGAYLGMNASRLTLNGAGSMTIDSVFPKVSAIQNVTFLANTTQNNFLVGTNSAFTNSLSTGGGGSAPSATENAMAVANQLFTNGTNNKFTVNSDHSALIQNGTLSGQVPTAVQVGAQITSDHGTGSYYSGNIVVGTSFNATQIQQIAQAMTVNSTVSAATGSVQFKLDEIVSATGGLTGPSGVTLHYQDNASSPIMGVEFEIVGVGAGRANSSGTATFGTNDGTYTLVSAVTNFVVFPSTTLVVSGTTTKTIVGQTALPPTIVAGQCIGFGLLLQQGAPHANGTITIAGVKPPPGSGKMYDAGPYNFTSNGSGIVSAVLAAGGVDYRQQYLGGEWVAFTTPVESGATFTLPNAIAAEPT